LEDRRELLGYRPHPEFPRHPYDRWGVGLDTLLELSAGAVAEPEVHMVLEVIRDA